MWQILKQSSPHFFSFICPWWTISACALCFSTEQKQGVSTEPVHGAEAAASSRWRCSWQASHGECGHGSTSRPAGRHRWDVLVWVEFLKLMKILKAKCDCTNSELMYITIFADILGNAYVSLFFTCGQNPQLSQQALSAYAQSVSTLYLSIGHICCC